MQYLQIRHLLILHCNEIQPKDVYFGFWVGWNVRSDCLESRAFRREGWAAILVIVWVHCAIDGNSKVYNRHYFKAG